MFPIIAIGFCQKPIPIIFNIVLFIVLHLICGNNKKVVFKFTLGITAFAAFSSITFVFDYGLAYCGVILLKSLSAGLCLSFFSLTTPVDDALLILSKNTWLKDVCDIAKSMERFLLLIDDECHIIYNSIKSRGGFDGFKLKIVNTGKMAGLLFINTMYRWKSIKEGLDSRGYRGYMPYLDKNFNFSYARLGSICIYVFCLAILIYIGV
jgi:cobalt/nickel transport system permease protein